MACITLPDQASGQIFDEFAYRLNVAVKATLEWESLFLRWRIYWCGNILYLRTCWWSVNPYYGETDSKHDNSSTDHTSQHPYFQIGNIGFSGHIFHSGLNSCDTMRQVVKVAASTVRATGSRWRLPFQGFEMAMVRHYVYSTIPKVPCWQSLSIPHPGKKPPRTPRLQVCP